jgi:hypothetical protein
MNHLLWKITAQTLRAVGALVAALAVAAALASTARAESPASTAPRPRPGFNPNSWICAVVLLVGGGLLMQSTPFHRPADRDDDWNSDFADI